MTLQRSEIGVASRGAAWLARGLVFALFAVSSCHADDASRIAEIRHAAQRIDAADEEPQPGKQRQLNVDLPHWELSGLFEQTGPIRLSARFSQGRLIREETYYLSQNQLLLLRVERSWDVDDDRDAPGPGSKQELYFDAGKLLRQSVQIGDSKPRVAPASAPSAADPWTPRWMLIARLLLQRTKDPHAVEPLENLPLPDVH